MSAVNKEKCYGRKGDEVKVIADHGNVVIVEDEHGNRFSVAANGITNEYVEKEIIEVPLKVNKKRKR